MGHFVLVVVHDVHVLDPLVVFLRRRLAGVEPVSVRTEKDAVSSLRSRSPYLCSGAIVAPELPDGDGFEVVDALRRLNSAAPVRVLAREAAPSLVERASLTDAVLLPAEATGRYLLPFVAAVERFVALGDADLSARVGRTARFFGLSPRETVVLELAVRGVRSTKIAESLGLRRQTVKSHVHSILRKCGGAESLDEVARGLRSAGVRPGQH